MIVLYSLKRNKTKNIFQSKVIFKEIEKNRIKSGIIKSKSLINIMKSIKTKKIIEIK